MKNYQVKNSIGVSIVADEMELKEIARHWVDEYNDFETEYHEDSKDEELNERLYDYPEEFSQVTEIIVEYMSCEIEELFGENQSTLEMFQTLQYS